MRNGTYFLLWLSLLATSSLRAQSPEPVASADTLKPGENEHPDKPKFVPETDQRFFFFPDGSLPTRERVRTSVWGARVGLLLPINVKVGAGLYFTNQRINESWEGYQITRRRLQYITAFVEPYYFRRKYWELSTPVEVGVGYVRYDRTQPDGDLTEVTRGIAIPLGVGVSISTKFPALRGLRPLRWFGINVSTGYRYTVQRQVPVRPATFNGIYYSISPAFFLDRFYEDFSAWRKRYHKK